MNVRTRDNVVHGMFKLDDVATIVKQEKDKRSLQSIFQDFHDKKVQAAAAADGVAAE